MNKKITISIISISLIIVLTILISFIVIKSNSSYIKVTRNDNGIYVESKNHSMTFQFTDIEEVEITDTIYGNTQLDGVKWNNCEVGVYKNNKYLSYYSFVEKKSKKSIVLKLNTKEFASEYAIIGLSSTEELNDLYNYINSHIK